MTKVEVKDKKWYLSLFHLTIRDEMSKEKNFLSSFEKKTRQSGEET